METEKDVAIPPGVVRRLKDAKAGFRLHVVILTVSLFLMILMILFIGPAGVFKAMVAFAVYLVMYIILLLKLYDDWQEEKNALLRKKDTVSKEPGLSQPQVASSTAVPTRQIDPTDQSSEKEE